MGDGANGRSGVVYRVDPRVFRDGDNDGVGDLSGLIAELDYVRYLGVDGLWVAASPPLPRRGISSLAPDPGLLGPSGSPALIGLLAAGAHRRGLYLLLDVDPPSAEARGWEMSASAGRPSGSDGAGRTATRASAATGLARRMLELGADAVRVGGVWQGTTAPGMIPAVSPPGLGSPSALFRTDDPAAGGPVCAVCADPAHCRAAPPANVLAWHPRRLIAAVSAGRGAAAGAAPLWLLAEPGAARTAAWFGTDAAKLAATLLLTLPGVSVVTSGDEVGVVDGPPGPEVGRQPGSAERMFERAPMPWNERPHGGFATSPWRPLVDGRAVPVSRQRHDPDSLLAFHRRLIALRRNEPTLVRGTASLVVAEEGMLAYLLDGAGSRFLVALNGGPDPADVPFLRGPLSGHVALATDRGREGTRAIPPVALGPNEAVVVRLSG